MSASNNHSYLDISAPVDESGDENSVEGQTESMSPVRPALGEERDAGIHNTEHDEQYSELQIANGYDAIAELNPWSIAAMVGFKRRSLPPARPPG
ncbi:hypothetical protein QBC36DRAFT_289307 [Triangularia setosa]|uniref:Uncharacterized protein n=1 Tax=Triangularia setosa TaxID=2587417 RepID=A0AAN7A714_9PEZI|nr:hypothetical protein QBC36DRAFT_289307 [Podospora setosa]